MNDNGIVEVDILGQRFVLKDQELSTEEIMTIVGRVRREIEQNVNGNNNFSSVYVAVAAAIGVAADLYKTDKKLTALKSTVDTKTKNLIKLLDELALK